MSTFTQKELTNKSDIVQNIYNAKRAHQSWVKKADKLVNGLDGYQGKKVSLNVDKTFIPLDSSSCEFGLWFNNYGIHLSNFESIGNFIDRIEEHHNALHETYSYIYDIFFVKPENRSLAHKILTFNSKKVTEAEKEKAKIHFEYLKRSSEELLELLGILETKVKALDYNELRNLRLK
jgi:hypothetical protein